MRRGSPAAGLPREPRLAEGGEVDDRAADEGRGDLERALAGVTPAELSTDTDILAAVAAGKGTLEITSTLVRCPVINFSALR